MQINHTVIGDILLLIKIAKGFAAYIGLLTTQVAPSELCLDQTLNLFTDSPIIQHLIIRVPLR